MKMTMLRCIARQCQVDTFLGVLHEPPFNGCPVCLSNGVPAYEHQIEDGLRAAVEDAYCALWLILATHAHGDGWRNPTRVVAETLHAALVEALAGEPR